MFVIFGANDEQCNTADDKDSPTTQDELSRVQAGFRSFLSSATAFYQQLIEKFQQAFGLVIDGSVSYTINADEGLHRSYLSCHRCFIFLGDIGMDISKRSWSNSTQHDTTGTCKRIQQMS